MYVGRLFECSVVGSSSMRISRRRFGVVQQGRCGRFGLLTGFAVLVTLIGMIGVQARDATVRGMEMNRFGRIAFEFDQTTNIFTRPRHETTEQYVTGRSG